MQYYERILARSAGTTGHPGPSWLQEALRFMPCNANHQIRFSVTMHSYHKYCLSACTLYIRVLLRAEKTQKLCILNEELEL